jgi:dipeptidase D
MGVLDNLEPKSVFHFFEEITQIPHGSNNVQMISEYLVKFAKDRNLEYIQDETRNVIIFGEASEGYEDREPIILQGHMDMVAVHDADYDIDMATQPLKPVTDGDKIWAEGTSLGGDDGIAVAYCLALLDSKIIPHPRLEVVITTNEETGMDGAFAIDLSPLKGRKLINIDSETEGVLLTSCAGGARFYATLPVSKVSRSGMLYDIEVSGLLGGHSGTEIIKEHGNANILLGRILAAVSDKNDISLVSINGGVADNAIPVNAKATIVVPEDTSKEAFLKAVKDLEAIVKSELEIKDPGVKFAVIAREKGTVDCLDNASMNNVYKLILSLPNGIQAMSASVPGLVETSLNLGVIVSSDNEVTLEYAVRSSVDSSKDALLDRLVYITEAFGAKAKITSSYPGWPFKSDSKLREHMIEVFKRMYGREPRIEALHAGVECGLFGQKLEGLDCISIGPDMEGVHTTSEKLSVASAARTFEYLCEVLK